MVREPAAVQEMKMASRDQAAAQAHKVMPITRIDTFTVKKEMATYVCRLFFIC